MKPDAHSVVTVVGVMLSIAGVHQPTLQCSSKWRQKHVFYVLTPELTARPFAACGRGSYNCLAMVQGESLASALAAAGASTVVDCLPVD